MRESLVERKLKDEVEKAGGLCWKFTSTTDGVPDRIILLYPGRVIFAETKPKNKAKKGQGTRAKEEANKN